MNKADRPKQCVKVSAHCLAFLKYLCYNFRKYGGVGIRNMKMIQRISSLGKRADESIKKKLRRVSLFRRLNTSFMLLIIIASIFLTFFSFFKYSNEISKNIDRYISLLVQNVVLKIEDTMQEYETEVLKFYDDGQVIRALEENAAPGAAQEDEAYEQNRYLIENRLYQMGYGRKYIVNLQFVTPKEQYYMVEPDGYRRGGVIRNPEAFYQTEFYLLPQEKKGYPVWFDTSRQTEVFYKNEQSVYGLANIVTLGIAVYAPADRTFLGVLLMNIDLNAFSGAMEGYEAYNDGNTFLIGEDGILMWFNPSISAPAFPKDALLFQEIKQNEKGITEIESEGEKLILAYEQIPNTDLFTAHVASLDVLYARTYQIRNLCILVLLMVVIACTVISYYVTSSISEPVGQLISVMQKTGDGKWGERYQNSGRDEITILGERFNEMADKTDQLIEQVYRSEIKRQQVSISWANARLDALLMQINPHFLYNTLDIIRWEAMYEAGGESPVTQMIQKFSQLYRMGMRTGANTITLQEGIEHARAYLEVINFRHSEKIQLDIDTAPEHEKLFIPQFILQPIMENAVVHAFDDASRGYRIGIRTCVADRELLICVTDNGKGMTAAELERLEGNLQKTIFSGENIGLVNVHQRIRLFYGEAYGVRMESRPEKGTTVTVSLPVRNSSENMEKSMGRYGEDEIQGSDC